MNEKHLLQTAGIDAQDWERTPVSVRQLVVQLAGKVEQLEQHLKELQVSNEQLNEKVNRNSKNSHSPPAADSPKVENAKKKKPTGGILNSDHYNAYNWVDVAQRQLCWAHLKREFTKSPNAVGSPAS